MIALKYEMQRIKQQAQVDRMTQELEKIKKEDDRSKWVQEQEQQLLEAKFRKQLAKENPITSTSSDPRTNAVFKPQGIKFVQWCVFLFAQESLTWCAGTTLTTDSPSFSTSSPRFEPQLATHDAHRVMVG